MAVTLRPGQTLGRFVLIRPLAQGGMAEVWLAEQRGAQGFVRRVAIKVLLGRAAMSADAMRWFRTEALIGGHLNYPNVVQVLDFIELEGGAARTPAIVMELVEGPTLGDILRFHQARKEPIPTDALLQMLIEITKGLEAAHTATDHNHAPLNIVHRDIKPGNFLLTWEGEVKVADFGIARAALDSGRTATGVVPGTLRYLSPEQASGAPPVDRRSDLFSLGLVLYELIQLEPFHRLEGLEMGPLFRELGAPDVKGRLRTLSSRPDRERLLGLLERCLAVDPAKRVQSAAELGRLATAVRRDLAEPVPLGDWLRGLHRRGLRGMGAPKPGPSGGDWTSTRVIPVTPPGQSRSGGRGRAALAAVAAVGVALALAAQCVGARAPEGEAHTPTEHPDVAPAPEPTQAPTVAPATTPPPTTPKPKPTPRPPRPDNTGPSGGGPKPTPEDTPTPTAKPTPPRRAWVSVQILPWHVLNRVHLNKTKYSSIDERHRGTEARDIAVSPGLLTLVLDCASSTKTKDKVQEAPPVSIAPGARVTLVWSCKEKRFLPDE